MIAARHGIQEREMCRFGEESRCALMTSEQIIVNLKQHANVQAVEGMARFGIRPAPLQPQSCRTAFFRVI